MYLVRNYRNILLSLRKIPVLVLFVFLLSSASGSDPYLLKAGAAESGMNFSCIMKPDFWSSFHNQALLPAYTYSSAGINYQNSFGISELGTRTAGFILRNQGATVGAFYSNFGYRDFRRHTAGLGCGIKLSDKISAGIQADFLAEKTPDEYYKRESITFETGILILPSDKVRIGIHVFNPLPGSLRKNFLPASVRAGAGIYLSSTLFACTEAEISTGRSLSVKAGFEYEAGKSFRLRGGFSTENFSFSFGAGYLMRDIRIDMGFASHQNLGVSSSVSLIFNLKAG